MLQKNNNVHVTVDIVSTTGNVNIDTFAQQETKRLKLTKQKNAALIVVSMQTRTARILLSDQLAKLIPAGFSQTVMDRTMIPRFKQKQYTQGIMLAIMQLGNAANPVSASSSPSAVASKTSPGEVPANATTGVIVDKTGKVTQQSKQQFYNYVINTYQPLHNSGIIAYVIDQPKVTDNREISSAFYNSSAFDPYRQVQNVLITLNIGSNTVAVTSNAKNLSSSDLLKMKNTAQKYINYNPSDYSFPLIKAGLSLTAAPVPSKSDSSGGLPLASMIIFAIIIPIFALIFIATRIIKLVKESKKEAQEATADITRKTQEIKETASSTFKKAKDQVYETQEELIPNSGENKDLFKQLQLNKQDTLAQLNGERRNIKADINARWNDLDASEQKKLRSQAKSFNDVPYAQTLGFDNDMLPWLTFMLINNVINESQEPPRQTETSSPESSSSFNNSPSSYPDFSSYPSFDSSPSFDSFDSGSSFTGDSGASGSW